VVQTPLYVDQLAVVARRGHPLAGAGRLDAASLVAFPWIMAPRSTPMRAAWEALFHREGAAPPRVVVECSSILAIHGLLLEGDWLTLLSPEQVAREVAAGRLQLLGPPLAGGERTIGMTVRAGWRPSAVQSVFLKQLRAQAASRRQPTSQD
jgi:DNA-binding transcriptional LysR family regulator